MDEGLSLEIIKATQTSLGKYVKRPPLNEKLLKKPPFRFLHDIITNVIKTTGFFEGLFDDSELISDNVKDRDSKILFLNKVICILSSTTGKTLSVKPSKIVAGQEPEKTNELLQCLAQALDNNLSSKEAVKTYKENGKLPNEESAHSIPKTTKNLVNKSNNTKKTVPKTTEKITNHEKDVNLKDRSDTKTRKKEIGLIKHDSQNKNLSQKQINPRKTQMDNKSKLSNKSQLTSKTIISNIANIEEIENTSVRSRIENSNGITDEVKNQLDINSHPDHKLLTTNELEINLKTKSTYAEDEINNSRLSDEFMQVENSSTNDDSVKRQDDSHDTIKMGQSTTSEIIKIGNVDEQRNEITPRKNTKIVADYNNLTNHLVDEEMSNYSKGSDIIDNPIVSPKKTNQTINKPIAVRPSSSRPGAPRLREKLENYLSETDNALLGKVNIISEHSHHEEDEDDSIIIMDQDNFTKKSEVENQLDLTSEHEHGHLVQQILNSQKELNQIRGKTEIEWQFGAQKAKEAQNQEIDTLRYNIQALSRVANPLGKLLDHMQEDVEVMRQELQQWTSTYEEVSKEMHKQKLLNERTLLPLHSKLKQIEKEIQEKHEKINDLKILVHKNSTKIEKLLVNNV